MTLVAALMGMVAGAIVGSFIATLCLRWARDEQAVTGRSRCDGCGLVLGARDLVPMLSAAIAGGKCRSCAAPIDPLHGQVEAVAAIAGAAALALAPNGQGALLAIFFWLLIPIAILDARHFWIPDRLSLLLAASGIAAGGLMLGVTLTDRLIGGVAGFAALALVALLYRRLRGIEGLGAGDPKLFGAIGLWVGWQALALILLIASLAGLAAALASGKRRHEMMPLGTLLCFGAAIWAAVTIPAASDAALHWAAALQLQ